MDPREGIALDGTIVTGARRDGVPAPFEPLLAKAAASIGDASLYVYGSVANGTARIPESDVDLLAIGLAANRAAALGAALSERFGELCRAVEVAAAVPGDFAGDGDEAYGGRVFLRHYCVHVAGPDPAVGLPAYPADIDAARGFNGDIGRHVAGWREALAAGAEPAELGRRAARKALLAAAGLVSVREGIWTTDREVAAGRWGGSAGRLLLWSRGVDLPDVTALRHALGGVVAAIAAAFEKEIGFWG